MGEESATLTAGFLKNADPDRYYASLVLSGSERAAVQALHAFSADVASVRDRVSEPAPGEIRLQWWDDVLTGGGHGEVRKNPLADSLLSAIDRYSLPTIPLQRLIAARRFDLYDDPMPDLESFEGYAGETVSVLYHYAAIVLNGGRIVEDGDAAGHLGVAHGLIGHLRAFSYNASKGRIFLPWTVLASYGVQERDIFSGTPSDELGRALAHLRELASEHLKQATSAIADLPPKLRPAFAMLPVLKAELRQLEIEHGGVFAAPYDLAAWRKIMLMSLWVFRNR